uniref:Uncharacterized protein n=1 Tax=Vespula pensylvanica TaxID=30213 RepID=A0A834U7Q5_VESPE|nr:hypothetical protein H0235_010439 [Vespula pensylvanica]
MGIERLRVDARRKEAIPMLATKRVCEKRERERRSGMGRAACVEFLQLKRDFQNNKLRRKMEKKGASEVIGPSTVAMIRKGCGW